MGVMSKLQSRQTVPASEPSQTVGTPQATSSGSSQTAWPDPAPCPTCLSPGFWIDVYGGGPHCRGCSPPSSPSLAAYAVWVVGTHGEYRWARNPKAEDEPSNTLAGHVDDSGEFVTWQLPDGSIATALRERVDHTRLVGKGGCYAPALACGPVGDMTLVEWFDRLAEFPPEGIGVR